MKLPCKENINCLCNFETHDCFKFFMDVLWRICYTDTALSFSMVKGLFLHLVCCTAYVKSNTILGVQTQAPWPTGLANLRSFSNRLLMLCMWFCNVFNVSVRQIVGCSWTIPFAHLWLTCHRF